MLSFVIISWQSNRSQYVDKMNTSMRQRARVAQIEHALGEWGMKGRQTLYYITRRYSLSLGLLESIY